jgi:transketolase
MSNSDDLVGIAKELRKSIVKMNCYAGSGHPGGALSSVEILTQLFFREMNFSFDNMNDVDRDRFILSKGHSCFALYAALAIKGFFSQDEFKQLRQVGGMLQGHPDRKKTPGVEFNSGSLGQGFSFALGCALAAKRQKNNARTYALLGDGELNEGQVWEGLMFGAHYQLDNLVAVVDYNKYQSDEISTSITSLEPLVDKFTSFGWHVIEIDGHDFREIGNALDRARKIKNRPTVILAHTVKGKGISFMENVPKWHGSMAPVGEERRQALNECGCEGLEL